MREVLYVLLFLGLYFIVPYFGALLMMKRIGNRFRKLGSDAWGWRLVYGLFFLGCAAVTFVIVISILWIIKKMI